MPRRDGTGPPDSNRGGQGRGRSGPLALEVIVFALIVGKKYLMKEVSPALKRSVQIAELGWLEEPETLWSIFHSIR